MVPACGDKGIEQGIIHPVLDLFDFSLKGLVVKA
jgi:hypothetical protein